MTVYTMGSIKDLCYGNYVSNYVSLLVLFSTVLIFVLSHVTIYMHVRKCMFNGLNLICMFEIDIIASWHQSLDNFYWHICCT